MKWDECSNDYVKQLDVRQFFNGLNPYGNNDNSIFNGFSKGKLFHDQIVAEKVGFTGGKVLDLLGGYGRWLPSLTHYNQHVCTLEKIPGCIELAKNMCNFFEIENVSFLEGDVSRVRELNDDSFDYVWVWSGLQYIDRGFALKQIYRVLVPGGKVFIGAYNSTGLMLQHIINGAAQSSVYEGASKWALDAMSRGLHFDGNPNYIDMDSCEELCTRFNFELISIAPQGHLSINSTEPLNIDECEKYYNYYKTVEFLAQKPKSVSSSLKKRRWNIFKS